MKSYQLTNYYYAGYFCRSGHLHGGVRLFMETFSRVFSIVRAKYKRFSLVLGGDFNINFSTRIQSRVHSDQFSDFLWSETIWDRGPWKLLDWAGILAPVWIFFFTDLPNSFGSLLHPHLSDHEGILLKIERKDGRRETDCVLRLAYYGRSIVGSDRLWVERVVLAG